LSALFSVAPVVAMLLQEIKGPPKSRVPAMPDPARTRWPALGGRPQAAVQQCSSPAGIRGIRRSCTGAHHERTQASKPVAGGTVQLCQLPATRPELGLDVPCPRRSCDMRSLAIPISAAVLRRTTAPPSPAPVTHETSYPSMPFDASTVRPIVPLLPRRPVATPSAYSRSPNGSCQPPAVTLLQPGTCDPLGH
jgi:hypothetical protein